jgi:hypothetical protein
VCTQLTQIDDKIHGLDRYLAVSDLGGRIRTEGYDPQEIRRKSFAVTCILLTSRSNRP